MCWQAPAHPSSWLYVPDKLLVQGDALATAERVRASEGLLRAAIVGEPCSATRLVFAALALFHLIKRVEATESTRPHTPPSRWRPWSSPSDS
jgi:hypothetical protein